MRKHWRLMAVCGSVLPLAVVAQDEPPPHAAGSEHEQHAVQPGERPASNNHSMAAMHEHMRVMREQMARIHATEDPVERQRLMDEHMQSMDQHMRMMEDRMDSMQQMMQQTRERERSDGAANGQ